MTRVRTKMSISVEAAAISRMLSLPAIFFKEYNAGELGVRVSSIKQLCEMLADAFLSTGLTTLFSFVYLLQIMSFAPALVLPALLVILAQLVFTVTTALIQMKLNRKQVNIAAKLNGLTFAVFSGIQKIKLAGAERRVFAKWAQCYKEQAELTYNPPWLLKIQPIIAGIIALGGTVVIYYSSRGVQCFRCRYMAF